MDNDKKFILSADEAISLLADGEYIHNFISAPACLVGCDYSRDEAIAAIRSAHSLELGGEQSKAMKHPIAVWKTASRVSFFAANMERVAALEAKRASEENDT